MSGLKYGVELTDYSEMVDGDKGNHHFAMRFDTTDGYVGISQRDGDEWTDRVLLSPSQVRALLEFLGVK